MQVYLLLAVLLGTHFSSAAPLLDERQKRNAENLNENVVRTLQAMSHIQRGCKPGEFVSKSTYVCESCDLATNYGSDMEYGHPCQAFYDKQKIDRLSDELNKIPWKSMIITAFATIAVIGLILAAVLPKAIDRAIQRRKPGIQAIGGQQEEVPLQIAEDGQQAQHNEERAFV